MNDHHNHLLKIECDREDFNFILAWNYNTLCDMQYLFAQLLKRPKLRTNLDFSLSEEKYYLKCITTNNEHNIPYVLQMGITASLNTSPRTAIYMHQWTHDKILVDTCIGFENILEWIRKL